MKDLTNHWLFKKPIAHRGLWGEKVPENSLAAFKRAMEKGYPIEIDIHILADNTLVIFHDDTLIRVTGVEGEVKDLKKEDLKDIYLSGTKEHIPTLDEVLDLVDGNIPIVIEIKNTGKIGVLEKLLLDRLKSYKGEYVIISFNPYSLEYFYKNAPEVLRGQLSGYFRLEDCTDDPTALNKMSRLSKFALKRMMLNKRVSHPDFIDYEAKYIPNKYAKKFSHLPLVCWTVTNQEDFDRLSKICDNITFEGFIPKEVKK